MKFSCFKFIKSSDKKSLISSKKSSSSLLRQAESSHKEKEEALERLVDIAAQTSSWYLPNISYEKSVEILEPLADGRFLIRQENGSMLLHLKENSHDDCKTLKLTPHKGEVSLPGSTKTFTNLSSLVVHHSIMKEGLSRTLVVAEDHSLDDSLNVDFIDIDVDPAFSQLVASLQTKIQF